MGRHDPDSAGNLFARVPGELPDELVEVLAEEPGSLRVERIVSRGHASPAGFWFDQDTVEFVVLLSGSAILRFEGEAEARELAPGDWVTIAKGRRHRVEATAPDIDSVWLAVHWR